MWLTTLFDDILYYLPIIAVITAIIGVKTYKLLKRRDNREEVTFKNRESNYNVYLKNGFRVDSVHDRKTRIILFNLRISNLSTTKNSFEFTLNIQYYDSSNNLQSVVGIEHNHKLSNELKRNKYRIFDDVVNIDEKNMSDGWVIFKQPVHLNDKKIENYSIVTKDTHKNIKILNHSLLKKNNH